MWDQLAGIIPRCSNCFWQPDREVYDIAELLHKITATYGIAENICMSKMQEPHVNRL